MIKILIIVNPSRDDPEKEFLHFFHSNAKLLFVSKNPMT